MSLKIITVGAKTDHGGTVISGSATHDINGRAIARLGDTVDCPKLYPGGKVHGINKIINAHASFIVGGVPIVVVPGCPTKPDNLAETIAANGPLALAATKRIMTEAVDWRDSEFFARQGEIYDYIRDMASRFGLTEGIRLRTEVLGARYDADRQRWTVEVRNPDGSVERLATGLSVPEGIVVLDDGRILVVIQRKAAFGQPLA